MGTSNIVDRLAKTILSGKIEEASEIIRTLDPDTKLGTEPLLEIYRTGFPTAKYLSALALARLGEIRLTGFLLQDLQAKNEFGHRDGDANVVAALGLGHVENNPLVIEALRQAMREKKDIYGWVTGISIPRLGLPQTSCFMLQEVAGYSLVLQGDKDSGKQIVRWAILNWHYHIPKEIFIKFMFDSGWESTISDLVSLFELDPQTVVSCLGVIGDERCVEPLTEALKHQEQDVRKKAIEALGKIGGDRALEAITQAINDKKRGVRQAAKKMQKKLLRDR